MSDKYTMSLSLNVLNHLGLNLYSNIPAVLSEIVANSWDADATHVSIDIDTHKGEIIIEDDGCGMDIDDINNKFLFVGYQKREINKESPLHKRKYMGRKGIGKLSMFSIANEIEIISKKANEEVDGFEINGFRMKVEEIKKSIQSSHHSNDKTYHPEDIPCELNDISNTGTKIVLKQLKKGTNSLTEEYVRKRLSRRFGIIGVQYHFTVKVNGSVVDISDRDYFHKLSYIWYLGDESQHYADSATHATKKEKSDNLITVEGKEYKLSGWIGSVENAGDLKDGNENLNRIVILVRGKLGQEDILASFSEGGLYSKYLIGEINADFFDDDDFDDMATSSRQEYREDDERYNILKDFIANKLKLIQSQWTKFRNEEGEDKAQQLLPPISTWLKSLKGGDKGYAKKMLGKVNQIVADDEKKKEILKYSILAFEKLRYIDQLNALENINIESMEIVKDVFLGLDELEATLYYQIVKERIGVIKKFQEITDENVQERVIQEYLFSHLWLLDPAWERVESTEYMEKSVTNALQSVCDKLSEDERSGRLDLGYRQSAGKHIVIELKRAGRIVKFDELQAQVRKYNSAMKKVLRERGEGNAPIEILVIVGKPLDNEESVEDRKTNAEQLKPINSRIVYYGELIENSSKAYQAYINENKKIQPLIEMFDQLENNLVGSQV